MPQYKYTAYDIRGKKLQRKKRSFPLRQNLESFLKNVKRMILIKFEILKKNKKSILCRYTIFY